jgi:hypothetical protein
MLNHKTVMVIGAGASQEAELPTGAELKEKIARLVDIRFGGGGYTVTSGDLTVIEALRHHAHATTGNRNINPLLPACRRIADAMPHAISIDNFIDIHPGDANIAICGKLAIARAILVAERHSLLKEPLDGRRVDVGTVEKTWFNSFLQLLSEGCPEERLEDRLSSLSLIIFNYDRCFEHFLYHGLQTVYGMNGARAAQLVNGMTIFHPYGTVGDLPWRTPAVPGIEFGAEPSPADLLRLSQQLKTFTEGTDPEASDIVAIRRLMLEAGVLVFLGFRFHRLNMQLLIPEEFGTRKHAAGARKVFATGRGSSKSDCKIVANELEKLLGGVSSGDIHIDSEHECRKLFQEHWRALSMW